MSAGNWLIPKCAAFRLWRLLTLTSQRMYGKAHINLGLVAGGRERTVAGMEARSTGCDSPGPQLGAQFAQLVKELRSEYAGAVTAAAQRIAVALFALPGRSLLRIMQQHGVTGTPALMQQQVRHHSLSIIAVHVHCGQTVACFREKLVWAIITGK